MAQFNESIFENKGKKYCACCFTEQKKSGFCEQCASKAGKEYRDALPVGSVLHGKYIVGAVMYYDNSYYVYYGFDPDRDVRVMIREFFPIGGYCRRRGSEVFCDPGNEPMAAEFRKALHNFHTEVRMMSGIRDDNSVARVVELFDENKTSYCVTELPQGAVLLSELVEAFTGAGRVMPAKQAYDILEGILRSLNVIHQNGSIHGNIRPENVVLYRKKVLLTGMNYGGHAYLAERSSPVYTEMNHYAPLEQMSNADKRGPWTDIYALGTTLYYMLTGRNAENVYDRLESFDDSTASRICRPGEVPAEIAPIIEKMTAVKMDRRFQTLEELCRSLQEANVISLKLKTIKLPAAPAPQKQVSNRNSKAPRKKGAAKSGNRGLLFGIAAGLVVLILVLTGFLVARIVSEKNNDSVFVPVEDVFLSENGFYLTLGGESVTVIATISPENATDQTVIWRSADESIAVVSNNGVVSAVKPGSTVITATAGDITEICAVEVQAEGDIPVESLTLDREVLEMTEGDDPVSMMATVAPEYATNRNVIWKSTNDKVATVSEDGVVTAVGAGEAEITATAGIKTAKCKVTVKAKITLDKTELTMEIGKTETITAVVEDPKPGEEKVTWVSRNEKIVTVSEDGVVTAVGAGETEITATVGLKTVTCKVMVTDPNSKKQAQAKKDTVAVAEVTLNQTELTVVKGEKAELTATVTPDDASDKKITWKTEDKKVATVKNGVITAKNVGETVITATAGGKKATCTVTVTAPETKAPETKAPEAKPSAVPVEKLGLSDTVLTLGKGKTSVLKPTISPDNATDKTVTWSSSNESVAKVTDGKVTAVGVGAAVITAKAGEQTATCEVTVVIEVEKISLSNYLSLIVGETETLKATVSPDNAADKTVSWTSDDPKIATVDSTGKVTAVSEGTTYIRAAVGGKTAECTVSVSAKETTKLPETASESETGHTHTYVTDAAVAATCTESGLGEGKHCTGCGEVIAREQIPALGHHYVAVPAVSPTCVATGLTEGERCDRCGDENVKQEEVTALGHHYVAVSAVSPTCAATGLTEGERCDRCGDEKVKQEVVPKTDQHEEEIIHGKAPTATEPGLTDGERCKVCGKITVQQERIDPLEEQTSAPEDTPPVEPDSDSNPESPENGSSDSSTGGTDSGTDGGTTENSGTEGDTNDGESNDGASNPPNV